MLPLHYPPRAMPWSYAPPGSSDGCPLPVPHPLPDEVEDDGEREEDDQRRQGRRVGEDRGRGEVDERAGGDEATQDDEPAPRTRLAHDAQVGDAHQEEPEQRRGAPQIGDGRQVEDRRE